MILDVGCGGTPRGDVNGDFFSGYTPHTRVTINPKKIPNFIRLDAHHLPFKNDSFDTIISYHVLEHLQNPQKALKDMKRVASKVIIRVPIWHLYSYLIEAIFMLETFMAIPILKTLGSFKAASKAVFNWKKRYSNHLWYINSKKNPKKINRFHGIPQEYEFVFSRENEQDES
jgi:SAM-dependent methyltransferase